MQLESMGTTPLKKERIYAKTVREPAEKMWSNCLKVGDIAYVSGLTARGDDGQTIMGDDEYEQSITIFKKIRALIEAAGGKMNDVVKMTIYVTRMDYNQDIWRARQEFFTGDFPACSLIEVSRLAMPEIYVEIEAIAHIGASSE